MDGYIAKVKNSLVSLIESLDSYASVEKSTEIRRDKYKGRLERKDDKNQFRCFL